MIDFTKTLYSLIFKGEEKICEAFEQAKSAVSFKISDNESNLFILLLQEDCTGRKGKPHHICDPFDDFEEGTGTQIDHVFFDCMLLMQLKNTILNRH